MSPEYRKSTKLKGELRPRNKLVLTAEETLIIILLSSVGNAIGYLRRMPACDNRLKLELGVPESGLKLENPRYSDEE